MFSLILLPRHNLQAATNWFPLKPQLLLHSYKRRCRSVSFSSATALKLSQKQKKLNQLFFSSPSFFVPPLLAVAVLIGVPRIHVSSHRWPTTMCLRTLSTTTTEQPANRPTNHQPHHGKTLEPQPQVARTPSPLSRALCGPLEVALKQEGG